MTDGGPAELSGLRIGDKLVAVNGMSCLDVDHYEAVDILKAAGPSLVVHFIREVTRIVPAPINDNHEQPEAAEEEEEEPPAVRPKSVTPTPPVPRAVTPTSPVLPPTPAPRLSIGSSSSLPSSKEVERQLSNGTASTTVTAAPNPAPRLSFKEQQAANNHVPPPPITSTVTSHSSVRTSTSQPAMVQSAAINRPSSQPPPPPSRTLSQGTVDSAPQQQQQNGVELRKERVYITLLRDHTGLGFNVSGGKGGTPFKEGSDVSQHVYEICNLIDDS